MNKFKSLFIKLTVLAFFIITPSASFSFTSNDAVNVSRQVIPDKAEPGDTVIVEITVDIGALNTEGNKIRGFYLCDNLASGLQGHILSHEVNLQNGNNSILLTVLMETGIPGDVYDNAFPYRFILETPPLFSEEKPLNDNTTIIFKYEITIPESAVPGQTEYAFPGFFWAGRIYNSLNQSLEEVFGYEEQPEIIIEVIPTIASTTTTSAGGGSSSSSSGGGGGGGGGGGSSSYSSTTSTVLPTPLSTTTSTAPAANETTTTTIDAPVPLPLDIISSPVIDAFVGVNYSYTVEISSGGQKVLYSLAEHPAGMEINEETGVVAWKPALNQLGKHSVEIMVKDDSDSSDVQSFSINVKLVEECPVSSALNEDEYALNILRRFRDKNLAVSNSGMLITSLYYSNARQIINILNSNPGLLTECGEIIIKLLPAIEESVNKGSSIIITRPLYSRINSLIESINKSSSPELHKGIELIKKQLDSGELLRQINISVK